LGVVLGKNQTKAEKRQNKGKKYEFLRVSHRGMIAVCSRPVKFNAGVWCGLRKNRLHLRLIEVNMENALKIACKYNIYVYDA
jgi:hypothetical protein